MTRVFATGVYLTPMQRAVWKAIAAGLAARGVTPTYAEIVVAAGLAGPSNAHYHISALERRGYVRRLPYRRQAIDMAIWPIEYATGFASGEGPARSAQGIGDSSQTSPERE